jgi:hypothetical protein
LSNFQRTLVIETTDSEDPSDEDIGQMFHSNINSKDPMDRLFVISRANALLREYSTYDKAKYEKLD